MTHHTQDRVNPDSKIFGANMGPIWGRQDPGEPHVGPVNFAISEVKLFFFKYTAKTRQTPSYISQMVWLPNPWFQWMNITDISFMCQVHLWHAAAKSGVMVMARMYKPGHCLGMSTVTVRQNTLRCLRHWQKSKHIKQYPNFVFMVDN